MTAIGCAVSEGDLTNIRPSGDERSFVVVDPQNFFGATVVPAIEKSNACGRCHALPFQGGNGDMRPYDYLVMRELLTTGPVSTSRSNIDNGVMPYMFGQKGSHVSTYCVGNFSNSPCREVREWATQEGLKAVDVSPVGFVPAPIGRLSDVDLDGNVWGWAADPDVQASPMSVELYIDGDRSTGTLLTTVVASRSFFGADKTGNVGFRFQLPDMYRDATPREIRAYGLDINSPGTVHELTDSPKQGTAYVPRAKVYYDSTVLPYVANRCLGCHALAEFQYPQAFYNLMLRPAPHEGATATATVFYRKMLGTLGHRGGAFCGGNPANAPCSFLSSTWDQEFD